MPDNIHRILVLFILFSVTVAACNAAPALTATATLPIDTPIPSATAKRPATATPTETPDPMKNAPIGADNWEKIDGKIVFYKLGADGITHNYDTGFKTPEGEIIWASSHIKNPEGIKLLDYGAAYNNRSGINPVDKITFHLLVKDGMQKVPFLDHKISKEWTSDEYSTYVHRALRERAQLHGQETQKVIDNLDGVGVSFPIIDAEGVEHTFVVDEKTEITVILVDPADITEPDYAVKAVGFQSKMILDKKITNKVTFLVSSTKPFTQEVGFRFTDVIFKSVALLFSSEGQTQNDYSLHYMQISTFKDLIVKGNDPFVIVSDTP